jgi:hypothetical protein
MRGGKTLETGDLKLETGKSAAGSEHKVFVAVTNTGRSS